MRGYKCVGCNLWVDEILAELQKERMLDFSIKTQRWNIPSVSNRLGESGPVRDCLGIGVATALELCRQIPGEGAGRVGQGCMD